MFNIFGKLKNDDKYQMMNVSQGEFVNRKIHATLVETWEKAERLCFDLEEMNPEYFFEARKV